MRKKPFILSLLTGLALAGIAVTLNIDRAEHSDSRNSISADLTLTGEGVNQDPAERNSEAGLAAVEVADSGPVGDNERSQDSVSLHSSFAKTIDYFDFADTYLSAAESGDADAQYLVAKSILDCVGYHNSFQRAGANDPMLEEHIQQLRTRANQRMDQLCGGFDLSNSGQLQEWLQLGNDLLAQAAENGNPAAMANELVNGLATAFSSDDPALLAGLDDLARDILASGDPFAVRKLSEYYSRSLRDHPVTLPNGNRMGAHSWTMKLGFELAACSLGYPCAPESAMVLRACSQIGHACEPDWDYLQMHQMMIGPLPLDDAQLIQQWVLKLIREGRLDELRRADG